jgi:hypothetical protein
MLMSAGAERQKWDALWFARAGVNIATSLHLQSMTDDPSARQLVMFLTLQRKGRVLEATAHPLETARRRAATQDLALLDELQI